MRIGDCPVTRPYLLNMKFCPKCGNTIKENKKLAQGVFECRSCLNRFYILVTSKLKL